MTSHRESYRKLFPNHEYPEIDDADTLMMLQHEVGNVQYLAAVLTKKTEDELRWLVAEEYRKRARVPVLKRLVGRLSTLHRDNLRARCGLPA